MTFEFVLLVWNIITFLVTLYDKIAAKALPKYRVPEKTLFALSVAFGGGGVTLGFLLLRHKIRKPKLFWPVVLVTAAEAYGVYALLW